MIGSHPFLKIEEEFSLTPRQAWTMEEMVTRFNMGFATWADVDRTFLKLVKSDSCGNPPGTKFDHSRLLVWGEAPMCRLEAIPVDKRQNVLVPLELALVVSLKRRASEGIFEPWGNRTPNGAVARHSDVCSRKVDMHLTTLG